MIFKKTVENNTIKVKDEVSYFKNIVKFSYSENIILIATVMAWELRYISLSRLFN